MKLFISSGSLPLWRRQLSRLALVPAVLALAACSVFSDKPKVTPLEPITQPLNVSVAWRLSGDNIKYPATVAIKGGQAQVLSGAGELLSVDTASGAVRQRLAGLGEPAAGVGSDGKYTAVVNRQGELVVVSGGQVLWRKPFTKRVVTAPLVAGERVFVLATDRSIHAYDVLDGRKLWAYARPGEPLTLSQTGVMLPMGNTLLVGQGVRLAAFEPTTGDFQGDLPLASPRGTNEVERLADLIGPVFRQDSLVCARSFQFAVACVNARQGQLVWSKTLAGTQGVAHSEGIILASDDSDRLVGFRLSNGEQAWTSEKLLNRGLSTPVGVGKWLVVGDVEGQLHFVQPADGQIRGRVATDGSPIVSLAVDGAMVLAVTRSGGLFGVLAP